MPCEETAPNPPPPIGSATDGTLALSSETTNQSYDAEGNLTGYTYTVPNQLTVAYQVNYLKRDGYLEQSTTAPTPPSGYAPATDTSIYDALGQRVAVQQTEQLGTTVSSTTRVFSYDGDGQILSRRDGTVSGGVFTALSGSTTANPDAMAPQHYVYAEGHPVASLSEAGLIQTSDGLTPYSDPQSSSSYTVQAGDTLQSIAQTVYGNANLWYVIADANAISLDSSGNAINLVAGTTLKLPAVSNSQNSSQTFTPYNPLKLIGSTTPALAYLPPPPQHCNALTELITAAITVVVTAELGPYFGGGFAGWAAAGTAANLMAQTTTDALGLTQGLSLKEALTAGVAAGVTGGLTQSLEAAAGTTGSAWATATTIKAASVLTAPGEAVVGAAGYLAGDTGAALVGEPTQFSWAGMAAAALGAAAATGLGLPSSNDQRMGLGQGFLADLAGGVLDGGVTREASLALGDHRVQSWTSIGADAFGNALGNSAAQWISNAEWTQLAPSAQQAADTIVGGVMGNGSGTATNTGGLLPRPFYEYPAPTGTGATDATPNGTIPLPNGDVVLPDGTVLAGDGTGPVQYLLPVNDRPSPVTAFWNGDHKVLPALLKGQDPATLTWNTPNFDPTAPVQLDLGYGIDSAAVNAAIAKSPILTAGLNEAFANGFSVQLVVPGGEDVPPTSATYGVIEIPAQYANSPTAIVSTLAHELGHVLWGDSNRIRYAQFASAHMTEPQFVQAQTDRYLQGEGVATLTNIAIARQIWGTGPGALPLQQIIHFHVDGAESQEAVRTFSAAYTDFMNNPASFDQAASAIGSFYSTNENPGNDLGETYGAMYSRGAQKLYTSYANRLNVTNATLQFQNRELQWQQLNALRANAISDPREEPAYEQALRVYESGNGGGQ